ncbi:MAG TPA: hypothetical protein VJ603_06225 [Paucimonas sp.]|nr:hypothetical protein [Paucimonas sp.]HJW57838.1 hypothetical protein [Burkholderiaceae bacterium]
MIDHVTLRVSNYQTSRNFYTRALQPLGYYGTFLLDPDGNNIEAVCHTPE